MYKVGDSVRSVFEGQYFCKMTVRTITTCGSVVECMWNVGGNPKYWVYRVKDLVSY